MKTPNQNIVLLHDSFASSLLIDTLEKLEIPIYSEGKLREKLMGKKCTIIGAPQLQSYLKSGTVVPYFNAEDCIKWIEANGGQPELLSNISFFKDKFYFKRAIAEDYPEYFITEVTHDQFDSFQVPVGKKLIIKPSIGFHSVGIRKFSTQAEWDGVKKEVLIEMQKYAKVFDVEVLSDSRFVVEEYLDGEEYACDAYFNEEGRPIILAIYHHPFADQNDTRDLVYYTGTKLMRAMIPQIGDFLGLIAKRRTLKNFPVHFEVRIVNNRVYPIEVNPLRFGGFGLADLPWYAYDSNSFEHFFKHTEPDWENILNKGNKDYYAFVVGQTPQGFNPQTDKINVEAYKKTFSEILNYVPIDASKYRFFSTIYSKSESLSDLTKYLTYDFDKLLVR